MRIAALALTAALALVGCGDDDPGAGEPATASTSAPASSPTQTAVPDLGAGLVEPVELGVEVLEEHPHDPAAFTQGLVWAAPDRLYESTGREGQSTLRLVDLLTGEVLRSVALDDEHFGEGLELVGDRLVQLTFTSGLALVWEEADFAEVGAFTYEGEGWGLCLLGDRLVHSDGTAILRFRDPVSFEPLDSVEVTLDSEPLGFLNELECVDGDVWANVWQTNRIVRIDPATGLVTAVVDASTLARPAEADVLNGIAHDPETGTFLLTGKLWPTLYRVRFVPVG